MVFNIDLDSLTGTIIGIAGALSVIGTVLVYGNKKLYSPCKLFFKDIKSNLEDLSLLKEDTKWLKGQFQPNGGTSMSDSLRRIELRQAINEGRHRSLISILKIVMFETNKTGRLDWVSKSFCDLTGKITEELIDNNWLNIIIEEHREKVWEEWNDAINQKREFHMKFKILTSDGKHCLIICRTHFVFGPNSEIVGYIGIIEKLMAV